jgi:hypothetical protein
MFVDGERRMPATGAQLAYLLKRRNPELYQKALEVKQRYGSRWDDAIAIAKGLKEPPQTIEDRLSKLKSTMEKLHKEVETLAKLKAEVEALNAGFTTSRPRIDKLEKRLETCGLERLSEDVRYLRTLAFRLLESLDLRFMPQHGTTCIHMDGRGYCTQWRWSEPKTELDLQDGEKYILNVGKYKLICAFCPHYTPRRHQQQETWRDKHVWEELEKLARKYRASTP